MRVGVIIPVLAPALWLEEAVRAVLGQDPAPERVVVVDDGSSPPLAVAGCEVVRRERAGGPAAARAGGLAALAGECELVALADADDVWHPGKLRAQLDALARHPDAAVCFGAVRAVGPDGRPTAERWPQVAPGVHEAQALAPIVYERNPIATSTVVARAAAIAAAGGFESELAPAAEDLDLWLRMLAHGAAFAFEPDARIDYRRHPGGRSADLAALAQCLLAVHERHAGLVEPEVARRARAHDLVALARGRVRQRRYGEARAALREAATLAPPTPRERALAATLTLPGLRAALGRRPPHPTASTR